MKQCQHHTAHLLCPQHHHGHVPNGQHNPSHHHHHHPIQSAFPSPSTSSAMNHGGGGGVGPQVATSACCSLMSPGSNNTLPANFDANACNFRTRTLPSNVGTCNLPVNHDQYTNWLLLSPRIVALFALSLVFILIWSTVISGVLVTNSLKEQETAIHTAELFELSKNVGQFAFEVGQEMLLSINSSISTLEQWTLHRNGKDETNGTNPTYFPDLIIANVQTKWNSTDLILKQVASNLALKGYNDFESDVQTQLEKLRFKCVHQVSNQWPSSDAPINASVKLYPILVDCVRAFQSSFQSLDTLLMKDIHWYGDRQSKLALTDLVIRQMPYTLFIRGMVHRFTSLGLGLVLVQSNFTHPFNMSEYFQHYFTSRQLIESSFVWNYRFLQKYLELERTDYQADMLLQFFDARRAQEHDFYLKMSSIFSKMFSFENLKRIRSYIKKKNVESVERLLVNGTGGAKYVADQDANAVNIQLNTDLIELMGLENIEQVMFNHEQMLSSPSNSDHKYNQLLRNQIGFMSRVQDFLNVSISSHHAQSTLNEKHNLMYHSIVATILFLSVLFCLALFLCTYCCSRPQPAQCCYSQVATTQTNSTFGRRMRRRLWNMSSPFSIFKSCFNVPTAPPKYPLLYKSSHQTNSTQCHTNSPKNQLTPRCPLYCSSPNSLKTSNKAGFGMNLAYKQPTAAVGTSKVGQLAYRYEKPRNGTNGRLTEATSPLIGEQSAISRAQPSSTSSSSTVCCLDCSDNACTVVTSCDTDYPNDGCRQCAATGKCSTCCSFNRSETCFSEEKDAKQRKDKAHSSSKQSLHSSTLSLQSDSKNSSKSTLTKERQSTDKPQMENEFKQ